MAWPDSSHMVARTIITPHPPANSNALFILARFGLPYSTIDEWEESPYGDIRAKSVYLSVYWVLHSLCWAATLPVDVHWTFRDVTHYLVRSEITSRFPICSNLLFRLIFYIVQSIDRFGESVACDWRKIRHYCHKVIRQKLSAVGSDRLALIMPLLCYRWNVNCIFWWGVYLSPSELFKVCR